MIATSTVLMTVYQNYDWPSSSTHELWGREIVHDFLPQVGQKMAVLYSEEEPSGSVHEEVVDVYFDFDGRANITMMAVIVDPDERGQEVLLRSIRTENPRNQRTAWYTDRDGDLVARLRECGWLPYDEWPQEWRA